MRCEASNYTIDVTLGDGSVFSTWIQYPEQGARLFPPSRILCFPSSLSLLNMEISVSLDGSQGEKG